METDKKETSKLNASLIRKNYLKEIPSEILKCKQMKKGIIYRVLLIFVVTLYYATNFNVYSGVLAPAGVDDQVEFNALRDFYLATDGENWIDKSYWLTEDISTWFGVTVENGDIIQLALNNNNLSGEIPTNIGNLQELQKLFLAKNNLYGAVPQELASIASCTHYKLNDNMFTSLPDFTGHPQMDKIKLQIDDNNFDFGDLEPFFDSNGKSIIGFISYKDQAEIGEEQDLTFYEGMPISISVETPGEYNTYQWQKMELKNVDKGNGKAQSAQIIWVNIDGATDSVYTVVDYVNEDVLGTYRCAVSNTKVPGLTLYTKEIRIEISDYQETRFYVNTIDLKNGLEYQATRYQIIAPELSDTLAFGTREGFVIVNPDSAATIILNILNNSVGIDVGYIFKVNRDGSIYDLKLASGMVQKDIHQFFYKIENSELFLYPVVPLRKEWSKISLSLKDGIYFSPDNDGFFDYLKVSGTETVTNYLLEIRDVNNNLVFNTDSVQLLWDGKSNVDSLLVPTGVYTYSIFADDKEMSGQMVVKY